MFKVGDKIEVFGDRCSNYKSSEAIVRSVNSEGIITYKGKESNCTNYCH